jgi:hypothetical protein
MTMGKARDTLRATARSLPGRAARRRLVAAVYLAYLATAVAACLVEARVGPVLAALLPLVLMAVAISGGYLLRRAVGMLADLPDAEADERQRAVRDRAYVHAYRLFTSSMVVVAVYGTIAWDSRQRLNLWLPDTWTQAQALMWGILLAGFTLPTAVVAWCEPENVDDAESMEDL